jgi:hypothetical protein
MLGKSGKWCRFWVRPTVEEESLLGVVCYLQTYWQHVYVSSLGAHFE